MPRYVVLTLSYAYFRPGRGASAPQSLELLHRWAEAMDQLSDGLPTVDPYGEVRTRGQQIMLCTVPLPDQPRPANDEAYREAVLNATIESYERAARWAGRRGVIGVAFDHGQRGVVQLAPGRLLEANRGVLQNLWLTLEQSRGRPTLTADQSRIMEIGRILRRYQTAVEFLSCRIGAGEEGRHLLNWLHVIWQRPVRALLGDLVIEDDTTHRNNVPEAYVVPPGAGLSWRRPDPGESYYRRWLRTPPTAGDLWQYSDPTPPPIDPGRILPPSPPGS